VGRLIFLEIGATRWIYLPLLPSGWVFIFTASSATASSGFLGGSQDPLLSTYDAQPSLNLSSSPKNVAFPSPPMSSKAAGCALCVAEGLFSNHAGFCGTAYPEDLSPPGPGCASLPLRYGLGRFSPCRKPGFLQVRSPLLPSPPCRKVSSSQFPLGVQGQFPRRKGEPSPASFFLTPPPAYPLLRGSLPGETSFRTTPRKLAYYSDSRHPARISAPSGRGWGTFPSRDTERQPLFPPVDKNT